MVFSYQRQCKQFMEDFLSVAISCSPLYVPSKIFISILNSSFYEFPSHPLFLLSHGLKWKDYLVTQSALILLFPKTKNCQLLEDQYHISSPSTVNSLICLTNKTTRRAMYSVDCMRTSLCPWHSLITDRPDSWILVKGNSQSLELVLDSR